MNARTCSTALIFTGLNALSGAASGAIGSAILAAAGYADYSAIEDVIKAGALGGVIVGPIKFFTSRYATRLAWDRGWLTPPRNSCVGLALPATIGLAHIASEVISGVVGFKLMSFLSIAIHAHTTTIFAAAAMAIGSSIITSALGCCLLTCLCVCCAGLLTGFMGAGAAIGQLSQDDLNSLGRRSPESAIRAFVGNAQRL